MAKYALKDYGEIYGSAWAQTLRERWALEYGADLGIRLRW